MRLDQHVAKLRTRAARSTPGGIRKRYYFSAAVRWLGFLYLVMGAVVGSWAFSTENLRTAGSWTSVLVGVAAALVMAGEFGRTQAAAEAALASPVDD